MVGLRLDGSFFKSFWSREGFISRDLTIVLQSKKNIFFNFVVVVIHGMVIYKIK